MITVHVLSGGADGAFTILGGRSRNTVQSERDGKGGMERREGGGVGRVFRIQNF